MRPDLLAADSTEHACLVLTVLLPEVSIMNRADCSEVTLSCNKTYLARISSISIVTKPLKPHRLVTLLPIGLTSLLSCLRSGSLYTTPAN